MHQADEVVAVADVHGHCDVRCGGRCGSRGLGRGRGCSNGDSHALAGDGGMAHVDVLGYDHEAGDPSHSDDDRCPIDARLRRVDRATVQGWRAPGREDGTGVEAADGVQRGFWVYRR